ncbi:hypothetical protein CBR_g21293 [Chara braunii]|uniref:Uncharacterized protein n=1 Tax=Chara braunii TaxID=69332 RepID=A0A388L1G8_CHABU|nr:hypothetical protein CBR_g21293 [Chara braunii]|eukprot:GBG76053.1 hypothetical protein CBR_g21293 [Chara braunii]
MDSSRWRTDLPMGNNGGFQTQDVPVHGSVSCSSPSTSVVQSFTGQLLDGGRGLPIHIPRAPVPASAHQHAAGTRGRFPGWPSMQSMPAGAMYMGHGPLPGPIGAGYGTPAPHSFEAGCGFGIPTQDLSSQHNVDRGSAMRSDRSWSPQYEQTSQQMNGAMGSPSRPSAKRMPCHQSTSMRDAHCQETNQGWPAGNRSSGTADFDDDADEGEACESDDDGDDEGDGVNIPVLTSENARGDVDSTQYSNQGQTLVVRERGRPHDKRKGKDNAATNKKTKRPLDVGEEDHPGEVDGGERRPHG